ncbi:hypothetical protein GCM10017687_91060 [Streptomyces echinatus]
MVSDPAASYIDRAVTPGVVLGPTGTPATSRRAYCSGRPFAYVIIDTRDTRHTVNRRTKPCLRRERSGPTADRQWLHASWLRRLREENT